MQNQVASAAELGSRPVRIAVITPYAAQVRLLREQHRRAASRSTQWMDFRDARRKRS